MPEIERHVVSAILWTDDGHVLLQQRDDRPDLRYAGCWTLFGGQVEDGEDADAAIRRELIEELELDDQLLVLVEVYSCPARTIPGQVVTVNHVYAGRLARPFEDLRLLEGQAMALFTPAEAVGLDLAFAQTPVLERWFARRVLPEAEGGDRMMTDSSALRGLDAIAAMFARARAEGRSAFMPYFPVGWPTLDESLDAVEQMAAAGADGFEIGMPFSDPLADGPVIQAATQKALENGVTVRVCLQAVRTLRDRGLNQPMLLMGYLNPLLSYGPEQFVADAKAAGADGLIIPDLPPEEGGEWVALCRAAGLALVFFLAPTSNNERIALVAGQASGFIYVVSLTGVTGARSSLPADLAEFLAGVKAQASGLPLVLGFGIGSPEQAVQVNGLTDGFIVGSSLVRAGGAGAASVAALAGTIARAIRAPTAG